MKKINKISLLIGVCIFALFSCTEDFPDRTPSPVQEGGNQAFIYETTPTDLVYLPSEEQVLTIRLGRKGGSGAATLNLVSSASEDDLFNIPATVTFPEGKNETDLIIGFDLALGQSASFSIGFTDEDMYLYGIQTITINIERDYDWVPAGTAIMTSEWSGTSDEIEVSHADGTDIYRLESPYYILDPDYCPEPGYHILFRVDEDFNAIGLVNEYTNTGEPADSGWWWILYNPVQFPDYCSFTNEGNSYAIGCVFAEGELPSPEPTYVITEKFVWNRGGEVEEATEIE